MRLVGQLGRGDPTAMDLEDLYLRRLIAMLSPAKRRRRRNLRELADSRQSDAPTPFGIGKGMLPCLTH
jgi:hypothetical protein